jgi:flagellar hook-length control protein FliK
MMPKAISLTDMLFRNAEGTSQERARDYARPAARTSRVAKADFLPDRGAASGDRAPAAAKSFQDRVRESRDRLDRKEHSFFHKGARADANPAERARENAKSADPNVHNTHKAHEAGEAHKAGRRDAAERAGETKPARGRSKPAERADRADKAEKGHDGTEGVRNDRATAADGGKASRAGGPEEKAGRDAGRAERGWNAGEGRPASLNADVAQAEESVLHGEWEVNWGEDGMVGFDALQDRLEELGVQATPEQLRDPAFLAEMLWMIDALPMASPLFEGAAPAVEGMTAAMAGLTDDVEGPDADLLAAAALAGEAPEPDGDAPVSGTVANSPHAAGETGEDFDWTTVSEPEREEIAALIREKLGALSDRAQFRAGPETAGRQGDQALPAAVQFARAGAEAPAAPIEVNPIDLTLSDPDRLRVLQAGLAGPGAVGRDLAGAAAQEGRQAPVDFGLETDEGPDSESLVRTLAGSQEAGGAENEGDMDGQPNLAGRNAFQNVSADSLAGKDGLAARDAASAFHNALDQARALDVRASQRPSAPMPHQGSPLEQTVMAQIARKMSALGLRGTEEIRIQLEPEHLGRVRINLELRNGALTARIGVENEAVRQIVDSNIAGLREGLENQGLKLQGLEVSVEQRHSSLFNPDGSNAREFFQRRGRDGAGEGAEAMAEEAPETDTGRRLGYNTMEFIA